MTSPRKVNGPQRRRGTIIRLAGALSLVLTLALLAAPATAESVEDGQPARTAPVAAPITAAGTDAPVPPEDPEGEGILPGPTGPTTPTQPGAPGISGDAPAAPLLLPPAPAVGSTWEELGPAPSLDGQVENIVPGNDVVGAVEVVAPHPTNPDILYVGAANGGVWRTTNATAVTPTWEALTDDLGSLSIADLVIDPTDPTHQTLVASIGHTSSHYRYGGPLTGVIRSTDGGDTWAPVAPGGPVEGQSLVAVHTGGTYTLAGASPFGGSSVPGLYIHYDTAGAWSQIALPGAAGKGVFDLAHTPGDPSEVYAFVQGIGVFHTTDKGTTWTNISASDTDLDADITSGGGFANNNGRLAVGPTGRLWVGVVTSGQPSYFAYTDDDGASWTAMDLPITPEGNGEDEGLSPREKPGGQGSIHFALAADPVDEDVVYAAGDRQDSPFPNYIGAEDFTMRMFRGDASVTPTAAIPSPQWEHMTHSNAIVGIPGGGTASNSAGHADSRDIAFDALGNMIEGDDGGVYLRTNPADNTGDWFSLNGNLAVAELHNAAYDTLTDTFMGAAQDTGTPAQLLPGSPLAVELATADGGVAIVDNSLPGLSRRYRSFQRLGNFNVDTFDAAGQLVNTDPLFGTFAAFVPVVAVNTVDPTRMMFGYEGGPLGAVEVLNDGDPFSSFLVTSGLVYEIVAGGIVAGLPDPEVAWVADVNGILYRDSTTAGFRADAFGPCASTVGMDAFDALRAVGVGCSGEVQVTDDGGLTWTDAIGSLNAMAGPRFSAAIIPAPTDLIVVGTDRGAFARPFDLSSDWVPLAAGMPATPVMDLDYEPEDDVLLAASLGRGAWLLRDLLPGGEGRVAAPLGGLPHDLTVFRDIDDVVVEIDAAEAFRAPVADLRKLTVLGGEGDDTVVIDLNGGPLDLPDGIEVLGLPGDNEVAVVGDGTTTVDLLAATFDQALVDLGPDGLLDLRNPGLVIVDDADFVTLSTQPAPSRRLLPFSGANTDDVVVSTDGSLVQVDLTVPDALRGPGTMAIDVIPGADTLLEIVTGDGVDTVNLIGLPDALAQFALDLGDGDEQVVADLATVGDDTDLFFDMGAGDGPVVVQLTDADDVVSSLDVAGMLFLLQTAPNRSIELTDATQLTVEARDGNDDVDLSAATIPTVLDGGPGDDVLRTGTAADVLLGGDGSDDMGGGGDDDLYVFDVPVAFETELVTEEPGGGDDTLNFNAIPPSDPVAINPGGDSPLAQHTNRIVNAGPGLGVNVENFEGPLGPAIRNPLGSRSYRPSSPSETFDLDTVFVDASGTGITFDLVSNSDPAVVDATLVGSILTVDPLARGVTEVEVRATNGDTYSSTDTLSVAVSVPPPPNQAPVAIDDAASVGPGGTVSIDVQANDRDDDGDTLTTELVTQPAGGTAAVEADGSVTYVNTSGEPGPDTFTYLVNDGLRDSGVATVTVTVGSLPPEPPEQPSGPTSEALEGLDRIGTAIAVATAGFPDGADTVVVSSAESFADALTAGALGLPLLLTPTDGLDDRVAAAVVDLGASEVVIVGGTSVVSAPVETALAGIDGVLDVRRLFGPNRFATAAAVAAELAARPAFAQGAAEPFIVSGTTFADPLAVAPVAAVTGTPILLVEADRLPTETADALASLGAAGATVIGGTAAVSADVAADVAAVAGPVDRVEGPNRYATAVAVVEQLAIPAGLSVTDLWVATGEDFPDSLGAGPAVAAAGGVLLPVPGNADTLDCEVRVAICAWLADAAGQVESVRFVGGTATITQGVRDAVTAALAPPAGG